MRHVSALHTAGAAAAAGALTLATLNLSGFAQAAGRPVLIGGTHPSWAVPSRLVAKPVTGTVNARVYLTGHSQAGLAAYAAAVSTPGTTAYRAYLTPAQATARFGATHQQVTAVRSWLTAAGLMVTRIAASGAAGAYIAVHGNLAAASKAFGVTFGLYRAPDGHIYRAPSQAARPPPPIASSVLSVSGLDTASHVAVRTLPAWSRTMSTSKPRCSAYFGQQVAVRKPSAYGRHWPWVTCGYIPRQVRSAYGVTSSGMTGRGQTVAIVDAYDSPTIGSDADLYAQLTGDPVFRTGQYKEYRLGRFTLAGARLCGEPHRWHGEQSLDVESLHGLAPAASIRYVAARSCRQADMTEALAFVVNHHLASMVSDSWGWPELDSTLQAATNNILKIGITEGIAFFFAAGDNGYDSPAEDPASSSRLQVEFPTSSPWVTSVGGTSLAIGRHGNYKWETSWGTLLDPLARGGNKWRYIPPGKFPEFYGGSGGGGVSTTYNQPFYQQGVVPAGLASKLPDGTTSSKPMRVIPDVSAVADPQTGLIVGESLRLPDGRHIFSLNPVGGTSLACPTLVGIEADAQQAAGYRIGFANPAIYARYGTAAFHDVTDHPLGPAYPSVVSPSRMGIMLVSLGVNGEGAAALRAVGGYDDATGVGSPASYIQSFGNGIPRSSQLAAPTSR